MNERAGIGEAEEMADEAQRDDKRESAETSAQAGTTLGCEQGAQGEREGDGQGNNDCEREAPELFRGAVAYRAEETGAEYGPAKQWRPVGHGRVFRWRPIVTARELDALAVDPGGEPGADVFPMTREALQAVMTRSDAGYTVVDADGELCGVCFIQELRLSRRAIMLKTGTCVRKHPIEYVRMLPQLLYALEQGEWERAQGCPYAPLAIELDPNDRKRIAWWERHTQTTEDMGRPGLMWWDESRFAWKYSRMR